MKKLRVLALSVVTLEGVETTKFEILEGNEGKEPKIIGLSETDEANFGKFEGGKEYDIEVSEEQWAEIESAAIAQDENSENTELKDGETVDNADIVDAAEAKQEGQE
ncbi:MAG: hypothetical protein H7282_04835 [Cytophagaceae bacterium]|nr:hypothetical protein [Cytophagaceae bacterium]